MASKTVTRSLKIKINDKEIDNSITKINKEIRELRKNLAAANNPADRKKYNAELEKAYQARRKINEEIRGTQGLLSKVKKQLGPTGIAMGAAFSATAVIAFADKVLDTILLFRELKQETKLLTGLQGQMLDEAVGGTKALADTFNTDYKENLQAANALSKQFGVTYEAALKAMENGYLAGANTSGDMLEQLKEYAPLMKEANIDLDQMVALIAQTEKEGIFNDKGIDAIKEGMLKIREGTDATRDAMNGLGIDTQKVYKDLEDGNTSYFEVMQLVSEKLSQVESQSPAVGTAIADIFGGPGEDAGLQFLETIQNVDLDLNSLIDTTDEYVRAQQLEVEATTELNTALAHLTETGSWWNIMLSTIKKSAGEALSVTSAYIESEVAWWTKTKAALGDLDAQIEISVERGKKAVENKLINDKIQEDKEVELKRQTIDRKEKIEKEAASKKTAREILAAQNKAKREEAKQQKRLEKFRENEEEYEALQRQLKAESDQRTFDLEEENSLEEEAQRLEQEILDAETEEEATQLIIERTQYIATTQLDIERRRDIERAKLAKASNEEIFAINKKYMLAQEQINIQFSKDQKALKIQEVKWEGMTQNQKLDLVRGGLSQAAELFNKNTAAYKLIKISETLMTTYQAAMNAYNSLSVIPVVGPTLGGLAAAAAVAAGLKQVSQIKNTKQERMPRYNTGGHTTSLGFSDQTGHDVAGVVHADEYVIPKFITKDPVYADTIGFLEQKRLEGLNNGYAEGGVVTTNQNSENDVIPVPETSGNSELISAINMLNQNLLNPQPAVAFFDNEQANKVNQYQTEVEQARKGAIIL